MAYGMMKGGMKAAPVKKGGKKATVKIKKKDKK